MRFRRLGWAFGVMAIAATVFGSWGAPPASGYPHGWTCFQKSSSAGEGWVTMAVAGTASRYVSYKTTVVEGSSTTVEATFRINGKGGWLDGKNETITSNRKQFDYAARNNYGLVAYQVKASFQLVRETCTSGFASRTYERVAPTGRSSTQNRVVSVGPARSYRYCSYLDRGDSMSIGSGESVSNTVQIGFNDTLTGALSLTTATKSSFDNGTTVTFTNTQGRGRWVCGKNNYPGRQAGVLQGHWKNPSFSVWGKYVL